MVSPEQLLDESVVAMVTQPVLHVRMETEADLPSYLSGGDHRAAISDGGIDFRNNELAYYQVDGFTTICDGGKRYLLEPFDKEWLDSDDCAINAGDGGASNTLKISGYVSDGVLTAGLTVDEAKAFVGAIRTDYPDYMDAGELSLVEHDGRQYVRMPFVLRTRDGDGNDDGLQRFIWSFRAIGVRWSSHVLIPGLGRPYGSQVEAVYYLDPGTRLPAYSESLVYDPVEDPGAELGRLVRVEYLWDGLVPHVKPVNGDAGKPEPPSWPAERLRPIGH